VRLAMWLREVCAERCSQLEVEHQKTATDESAAVLETEDVYTHFIALVEKGGHLYELDGRKDSPVNHGATSPATLLEDSMAVMRQFMDRDPGEIRFTMLALAPNPDE
jgi:ubiquitin carboxyl-terminal hydrolase L3